MDALLHSRDSLAPGYWNDPVTITTYLHATRLLKKQQPGGRLPSHNLDTQSRGQSCNAHGDWPQEIILKSPPYFILENKNNYDKSKVVSYLKSGYPMIDIKEFKTYFFNCGAQGSDIGIREITDGEWIWPEELIHYVEHHYIDIPSEFLLHVKQKNFQVDIPSSLKDELGHL